MYNSYEALQERHCKGYFDVTGHIVSKILSVEDKLRLLFLPRILKIENKTYKGRYNYLSSSMPIFCKGKNIKT